MHIVPIDSFDPSSLIDIRILRENASALRPIKAQSWGDRINFDGVIIVARNQEQLSYSYIQIYRNGIIEAVNSSLLNPPTYSNIIRSETFEKELVDRLRQYLGFFNSINIQCPVFTFLTLIGVQGYTMGVNQRYSNIDESPIDRDTLLTPEVLIESFDKDIAQLIKPCFDSIWNACGWEQSLNYLEGGIFNR